ncbi:hypothetical protein D3C87_1632980 [compost metagenome]
MSPETVRKLEVSAPLPMATEALPPTSKTIRPSARLAVTPLAPVTVTLPESASAPLMAATISSRVASVL